MMKVDERTKFKCSICASMHRTYIKLSKHIETTHSAEKMQTIYFCDLCGMDYYSKIQLESHMKRVHCGAFKCFVNTCKVGFVSRMSRKEHFLFFHNRNKKVKSNQTWKLSTFQHHLNLIFNFQ